MNDQLPLKGRLITDQAAEDITRAEELAYELKVGEVMTTNPLTVTGDQRMDEVLELFRTQRISGAPVLQNGKLMGVISMEDLINSLRKSDLHSFVAKYMTAKLITIRPTEPVIEALKLFVNTGVGRLLVINEQGQLAGIITKGDITNGLLRSLQKDYQAEEIRRYRASHLFEDIESDRTSLILRYRIKARDFMHGGAASSQIKRALLRLGANPQIARRCGIAVYEAEMNLIIHTNDGGLIRTDIETHRISIEAVDEGPGIANVELAMKPGYSTASQEIRELGFGAGMGLVNISRCTDEMRLESELGRGTRLRMKILLPEEDTFGEGYSSAKETEK